MNLTTQQNSSHVKTPEAARRQAEAGARNLATWNHRKKTPAGYDHGIFSVLRGGRLRPGMKELIEDVNARVELIEDELGGHTKITARQRALLSAVHNSLLVLHLAYRYIAEYGIVDKRGEPRHILEAANAAANTLLRYSIALESGRVSGGKQAADSLEDVLREHAENHRLN